MAHARPDALSWRDELLRVPFFRVKLFFVGLVELVPPIYEIGSSTRLINDPDGDELPRAPQSTSTSASAARPGLAFPMKKCILKILSLTVSLAACSAVAQFGGRSGPGAVPKGVGFGGPMVKLFEDHSAFSATTELQTPMGTTGENMTVPGKVSFSGGNCRFEMDMTLARGRALPPNAAAQMKAMGMDRMIAITRPDKKVQYLIYPGLQAYVETPLTDPEAATTKDDFKMETADISHETFDGHECAKKKVEITDKEGRKHLLTVWHAADLSKFPVKTLLYSRTSNSPSRMPPCSSLRQA
jgi:hypothetical protein